MELFKLYIHEVGLTVVILFILLNIGNKITKNILSKRDGQNDSAFKNGSIIGNLERILVFLGIIIQEWTLIGIVVALKTIARYKELDNQDQSEYFLIGSMFSLLWAILVATIFVLLIKETEYFNELKFLIPDKTLTIKITF